ncbi:peptidoglycan-binding domain-containing protein [Tropicimonas sp. IMCC34043]|uniref:peptidoglycan-binding domain-containing protein n=1 Tax=Tropicimonas sp. IMCC34043 TaxID=2248760 RepID=UPI000E24168A|nr:peptidoglycan-binding domain-containing protein [Tropicimonas sp. IMCC34043]
MRGRTGIRGGLAGLALTMVLPAAGFADRALLIGTPAGERRGLFSTAAAPEPAKALTAAGFSVLQDPGADAAAMRAQLSAFLSGLGSEPRAVIQLTGHFVQSGGRTWLLQSGAGDSPDLATVAGVGLSLETVLQIAGRVPGASVVAIGIDPGGAEPGTGLSRGVAIDPAAIPQGVTLVQGPPEEIARFVAGPLLAEGTSLPDAIAAGRGLSGQGFLSSRVAFVPFGVTRPTAPPDAAEVERAIWQAAAARDSVDAYQGYLARFPAGAFVDAAQQGIERIQGEPNREARLAEEALALPRDQVRDIQRQLALLGFEPGGADGVLGPASRAAITRFQVRSGFPDTGFLTQEQIGRLALQSDRIQAETEADARRTALERQRRDRDAWSALGEGHDEAGLRTYLQRFPDGAYAVIARERLARIDAAARQQADALDQRDWERAQSDGTEGALEAYLAAHPQGAHAAEAKGRLAAMMAERDGSQQAARDAEASLGLTPVTRLMVEQRLVQLGQSPGPVDGTFDPATRGAIREFQTSRGIPATGYLDQVTVTAMLADLGSLFSPGR